MFGFECCDEAKPVELHLLQVSDPCIPLCQKQIKTNCFQKLLKDIAMMRPSLLSCIFCKCEIPVTASQSKYQEHLQVELTMLVDVLLLDGELMTKGLLLMLYNDGAHFD